MTGLNQKILDNAPMSIITIDKDGYITSANKFFLEFSRAKKFKRHNIFKSRFFIREKLAEDYKKLFSEGTVVRKDRCYEKNHRGEDRYLKIVAVPIRNSDGEIEGALSMASDNTEAVLYEKKLQELNDHLENRVAERTIQLGKANEDLNKALEMKAMFMADVSHELRTSLAIIQGNLELLEQSLSLSAQDEESSDQVIDEIVRMSEMLKNLTMIANSDANIQKLNYQKFNINKSIASICRSFKVVADKENITITHDDSKTMVEILADKAKIEELISNLVRNAIKYNTRNGWIKIRAKKNKNSLEIKVRDGGIGISKEHLPYIFERFYRADKARTRKTGGFGLGLAICKWIADLHNGDIEARSKIGQGTIFTVRLPLAKIS